MNGGDCILKIFEIQEVLGRELGRGNSNNCYDHFGRNLRAKQYKKIASNRTFLKPN